MSALPEVVQKYFEREGIAARRPLVLTFDGGWKLLDLQGDAAAFGLDALAPEALERQFRELCIGYSQVRAQHLAMVGLPQGATVDLHLVPERDRLHLALLDAAERHAQEREWQQRAQEAKLELEQQRKARRALEQTSRRASERASALEQAQALNRALIAALSHEFRAPLNAIQSCLSLLETRLLGDAAGLNLLGWIRRSAGQLEQLGDNLVALGTLADGQSIRLRPRRVHLDGMAQELSAAFEPLARLKRVAFQLRVSERGHEAPILDELRLRQVLINLLAHTLRRTQRGGVSAGLTWDGRHLAILVTDTGPSLSAAERSMLYSAELPPAAAAAEHGLELYVVQQLVAQLGGRIVAEVLGGSGMRLSITVPAMDARVVERERQKPSSWPAQTRARIALPDAEQGELLRLLLTELGFAAELILADEVMTGAAPVDGVVVLAALQAPLAFRLRARGCRAFLVGVGAESQAHFDALLEPPLTVEQVRRVLGSAAA